MPSRVENILQAMIDGSGASDLPPAQSRNEALLMQILESGGGGGGSALPSVTTDDDGKVLMVVNGAWAKGQIPSATGVSF